jgi:uncharacterized protein YaiE (UPF0345 family)
MSELHPQSIIREANIYFDGRVTSRTVNFADGSVKTLGIMLPGDYEFNTDARERMEILSGDLEIALPGESWRAIRGGESFDVPAKASFKLKIRTVTDYCCSYL